MYHDNLTEETISKLRDEFNNPACLHNISINI